jgi:DNA-binding NarL/FixJ family response regulator
VIRILLVDDHPALRAGLHAVIRAEPGLVPVGAAAGESDLWPLLNRARPDVVLVDYHLPERNGLVLCHRIKGMLPPPRVLIYSAYAHASLTVPAIVAGADGVVSKSAPANELFEAIRSVARGQRVLPPVTPELLQAARDGVSERDRDIVEMLVDGRSTSEIAKAAGIETRELSGRIETIIDQLKITVPGSTVS